MIGLLVYSVVRVLHNRNSSIDFYDCIVDNYRRHCCRPQPYNVNSKR